jgi:hypothetical protein
MQNLCGREGRDRLLDYEGKKAGTHVVGRVRILGRSSPHHHLVAWPQGQALNTQKTTEQRISPLLPGLYPPQVLRQVSDYCSCGHAALTQVAKVVCGAAFHDALKWITPSSLAQKPRTPVWLKAAAEPPTV